jgi:hypothetical protein
MPPIGEVKRIKEAHKNSILAKPHVVGVGVGYRERAGAVTDELCVVALVAQKLPKAGLYPEAMVPKEVGGVATDVIEVGVPRALQSRTARWRPAPGGVTIGHYQITAGTLGCVVRDKSSGERLILSNNHVLANSNDGTVGDAILQPGPFDGGREDTDLLATLVRFVPLRFSEEPPTCGLAQGVAWVANTLARLTGSSHRLKAYRSQAEALNVVDAALARPLADGLIVDEILEIGVVAGTAEARLGLAVRKSGRSSGLSRGEIRILEATIDVEYAARRARFEGQIVSTPMSEPGDSGSLLVSADEQVGVGLLFAGSQQATIFNPIQAVLQALRVTL